MALGASLTHKLKSGKRLVKKAIKNKKRVRNAEILVKPGMKTSHEKLFVKRKAFSPLGGKDSYIRPSNPRVLTEISLLHITCCHSPQRAARGALSTTILSFLSTRTRSRSRPRPGPRPRMPLPHSPPRPPWPRPRRSSTCARPART